MKKLLLSVLLVTVTVASAACGKPASQGLTKVTLMLDWVPNTNHTGIYVAQEKGYFKEAGLDVTINQPGEVSSEAAVGSGVADFGISTQEVVTLARAKNTPVVSIAAVLQHNTSGFASLAAKNVKTPKDWQGLTYGSWGSDFEEPTLRSLMQYAGGDYSKLKMATIGNTDPTALLAQGKVDIIWIFYGWEGLQAKQQGVDISVVMMKDYFKAIPDYYTPIVITNENMISKKPEVVKAFLKALSRGYDYAIQNPDDAANILLKAAPELDATLVKTSQQWISSYYKAEAPRWGEQRTSVWQDYVDWMAKNNVLKSTISVPDIFTNKYLP